MLPVHALGFLRRRQVLAQPPQGLCLTLALGEGGVADQAVLQRPNQEPLDSALGAPLLARGRFHKHVPGKGVLQRLAYAGDVPEGEGHALARHQLEGLHGSATLVLGPRQQSDRRLRCP